MRMGVLTPGGDCPGLNEGAAADRGYLGGRLAAKA